MIPVWHGKISNDTLLLDKWETFATYSHTLNGNRIELVLRKERSQRSNNQNSYYWGVVLPILGDYFGYDADEMHDALKMKFLRHGAADLETVKSTTKLNTAEFEDYLERIRRWALTEYSLRVPMPNEVEGD